MSRNLFNRMIESVIKEYGSITDPNLVLRVAKDIGIKIDKNWKVRGDTNLDLFLNLVKNMF